MTDQKVEQVDVRKILADENQPRKYFPADSMFQLKQSIRKHGIKVHLTLEDLGNGKYLIIDGERRFRTAIELGLETVPAVIEAPKSEEDRLIEQFSIQENHQSWTPIEKAMAILNLSRIVGRPLSEVCKMLDIDGKNASRYAAFAELADKESFVKNEVPLDYALFLKHLKSQTKIVSEKMLEEEFTRSDEKKMEHQITKMIVRGDIQKRSDITKLSDSFRKNPALIEKFMTKDNVTPSGLFLEAKAQGAYNLRNAVAAGRQLSVHIESFMKLRDMKISDDQLKVFKRAKENLDSIIGLVE